MGPCCFLKVGEAGIGAFETSDLVLFTKGVSTCGRSEELPENVAHSFSVTILVDQNIVLGLSVSAFFRGVHVDSSSLGPGVDFREVEDQLRGCCLSPWSRQCLRDQGTAGSRSGLGQKVLEST